MALYSHDELPITNVQTYDDKYCQALICTCESQKLFICVVYRPPECPSLSFRSCLDFIDQYIAQGADGEYQLSLLGDFNLPIIGWSNHSIFPGGSACSIETAGLLLDFMSENLCTQHVFHPTRNNNILDLYISNSEDLVSHVSTSDTPLSDHRRVEILLSYNSLAHVTRKMFQSSFLRLCFSYVKLVAPERSLQRRKPAHLCEFLLGERESFSPN